MLHERTCHGTAHVPQNFLQLCPKSKALGKQVTWCPLNGWKVDLYDDTCARCEENCNSSWWTLWSFSYECNALLLPQIPLPPTTVVHACIATVDRRRWLCAMHLQQRLFYGTVILRQPAGGQSALSDHLQGLWWGCYYQQFADFLITCWCFWWGPTPQIIARLLFFNHTLWGFMYA